MHPVHFINEYDVWFSVATKRLQGPILFPIKIWRLQYKKKSNILDYMQALLRYWAQENPQRAGEKFVFRVRFNWNNKRFYSAVFLSRRSRWSLGEQDTTTIGFEHSLSKPQNTAPEWPSDPLGPLGERTTGKTSKRNRRRKMMRSGSQTRRRTNTFIVVGRNRTFATKGELHHPTDRLETPLKEIKFSMGIFGKQNWRKRR